MPYVRVKQKYQVTIPVIIRNKLNLHEGDTLEIKELNGNLVLVPQIVTTRIKNIPTENKSPLLSMIGANSGSGLYKSAKDIDDYISNLRNEWN